MLRTIISTLLVGATAIGIYKLCEAYNTPERREKRKLEKEKAKKEAEELEQCIAEAVEDNK